VIEETIGEVDPAYAAFIFIILGSERKNAQTLKTDQDNAIIYKVKPMNIEGQ
jgi:CBS domain-containing protein